MCVEARLSVQQRRRGSLLRSVSTAATLASRLSSNFCLCSNSGTCCHGNDLPDDLLTFSLSTRVKLVLFIFTDKWAEAWEQRQQETVALLDNRWYFDETWGSDPSRVLFSGWECTNKRARRGLSYSHTLIKLFYGFLPTNSSPAP